MTRNDVARVSDDSHSMERAATRSRRVTLILAILTLLVLALSVPGSLRDAFERGGFYLFSQVFFEDIPKRLTDQDVSDSSFSLFSRLCSEFAMDWAIDERVDHHISTASCSAGIIAANCCRAASTAS